MQNKTLNETKNHLTKEDLKEMLRGLTEKEIKQVSDWLLNPQ